MAVKRKRSTRRSDTSLELLSLYTFFLDRALESNLLRDSLKQMGARVEMHNYHFQDDAEDVDWLPVIARRGWVILSKDQYNWLERRAIKHAGGRAFLLVRCDLPGEEQATIISKALPEMLRVTDLTPAPFIAKTYRDGSVHLTKLD